MLSKKTLVVIGMAVAAAVQAHAASATVILLNPGPFGTATFSNNNLTGSDTKASTFDAFSNSYSFTLPGAAGATASLTSIIYAKGGGNVNISSILLDGTHSFVGTSGIVETWYLNPVTIGAGAHTIVVSGTSNGTPRVPASYAGTLNVAAVPEPASWGMLIAGFGIVGGSMRARRRQASFATA